jgi:hypothetical protein
MDAHDCYYCGSVSIKLLTPRSPKQEGDNGPGMTKKFLRYAVHDEVQENWIKWYLLKFWSARIQSKWPARLMSLCSAVGSMHKVPRFILDSFRDRLWLYDWTHLHRANTYMLVVWSTVQTVRKPLGRFLVQKFIQIFTDRGFIFETHNLRILGMRSPFSAREIHWNSPWNVDRKTIPM